MLINQKAEEYVNGLLSELSLGGLAGKEREETENMLRERFERVIFNATVRNLPEDLKIRYLKAASEPEIDEKKIIEITSAMPELSQAIEAALLFEFESLKHAMGK